MLNGLSLFSGIGGIDVALSEYVRPIAYCERESYCQGILFSRMASGELRKSPIWDDVTTLNGEELQSRIDIIYGGFPCQDISVAGNGKGLAGERSGLFTEIIRLAKDIRPRFVFLENVPAIRTRGLDTVIKAFAKERYDCRWTMLRASAVGALHRRERWFLLAHSNDHGQSTNSPRRGIKSDSSQRKFNEQEEKHGKTKRTDCLSGNVANPMCQGLEKQWNGEKCSIKEITRSSYNDSNSYPNAWKNECPVGRMADGIPNRMERIKSLGNAVVPQQAKEAFEILMGLNK